MKRSRTNIILFKLIFYTFIFSISAPLLVLTILTIGTSWVYPDLLPKVFSLKYLINTLVSNSQTIEALADSFMIAALVTGVTLVIAIPAAKAIGLYKFKGKELIKGLVLLPLIVPGINIITGIHVSMIKLGLTGKIAGIVLIHTIFTLPYAIRLLTDVFEIIGEGYEQQAWMLGSGALYTFVKVTLPLITPGVLSAAVMSFIVSLSQYITTFMIGGGKIITLPMLMVPFIQSGEIQIAAVYSLLFVFTALAALSFIEKILHRYYRSLKLFYI